MMFDFLFGLFRTPKFHIAQAVRVNSPENPFHQAVGVVVCYNRWVREPVYQVAIARASCCSGKKNWK